MEIAVVKTERTLTNKRLDTVTKAIAKCAGNVMTNYAKIGGYLAEVNENKLYKEDFETFEAYVGEMFNMSRKTAYRIIKVTKNIILPDSENKYFAGFSDSALAALTGAGNYDDAINFCNEHNITEMSTVREINAALKDENSAEESLTESEESLTESEESSADWDNIPYGEIVDLIDDVFGTSRTQDVITCVIALLSDLSYKINVTKISDIISMLSAVFKEIDSVKYESEA